MSSHDHAGDESLADLLDLDAEVLHAYWTEALDCVEALDTNATRLVDLGAGTGTATIALAQRFGDAEVIALDSSAEMLQRIEEKATKLGLDDRIRVVQADLDAGWPDVGPIDITWASMSLHHMADPGRVLRDVFAATRPGGLIAVAEFAIGLRFLPDDLGIGTPGLEERCLDALAKERAHALPAFDSDWTALLDAAGFSDISEHDFAIEVTSPRAAEYAQLWFRRLRSRIQVDHDDLETLDALVHGDGPHSLRRRSDLVVRGTRSVMLARR